jgi:1-phosphatidylinositol-4-phosphate 5-kinase
MLCGKKSRKALSQMDINLKILSQRYRFSNKELYQYTEEFKKISSGLLKFSVQDFCKNIGPLGLDSTRLISDRIFAVMNKTKSGEVTLKEYLEYMDILMYGTQGEKLYQTYRLITLDNSDHITYNQFESWILCVWKIHNILTGTEISATKENIKAHFDKLDTKADGIIDFEEFQISLTGETSIGQWFDVVNNEINHKLQCFDQRPLSKYSEIVNSIQKDLESCMADLNSLDLDCNLPESAFIDDTEAPEILLYSEKLEIPNGDKDSVYETSANFTFQTIGDLKIKLSLALDKLNNLKTHDQYLNKETTLPAPCKIQNSIRWGNNDWNLIMNMMIGIQKSVSVVNTSLPSDVSTKEFLEKTKHKLLPVKSSKYTYKFTDYAPVVFQRLRNYFGVANNDYTKSLGVEKIVQSLMANEFASLSGQCSSGKSGSFFFYSEDGLFMLKTITESEYEFIRRVLPDYYFHMINNPNSLLTKFYGLHKITGNNPLYFLVMGNLFTNSYEIHQKYDLKGSTYGRKTNPEADKSIARKDLDFKSKISIGTDRKQSLISQIDSDTELLQRLEIIDYSFLLGIHELDQHTPEKHLNLSLNQRNAGIVLSNFKKELYFIGIIDFLTRFNIKKKFEHFVMGTLHGKEEVSCIPPLKYRKRFIKHINSITQ